MEKLMEKSVEKSVENSLGKSVEKTAQKSVKKYLEISNESSVIRNRQYLIVIQKESLPLSLSEDINLRI